MGAMRSTRGTLLVGAVGYSAGVVDQRAMVPLTAAQIIAMNGGAVTILAAPGAGKVLIVTQILFAFTAGTQFTNGGVVTFQYASGGAVVHVSSIPAATITSAASSNTLLAPNTAANGIVAPANTAITITNATAAFATGTGTAKVFVAYRTVTL